MSFKNKKSKIAIFSAILLILILSGCVRNNIPDNYADIIQAAAYVNPGSGTIPDPTTEIITGTISFNDLIPAASPDPVTEAATEFETAEPSVPDAPPITETTEIIITADTAEEQQAPYVITPSGRRYHYPACRTAQNIKQYLSKEEAEKSGYTPCGICKPE